MEIHWLHWAFKECSTRVHSVNNTHGQTPGLAMDGAGHLCFEVVKIPKIKKSLWWGSAVLLHINKTHLSHLNSYIWKKSRQHISDPTAPGCKFPSVMSVLGGRQRGCAPRIMCSDKMDTAHYLSSALLCPAPQPIGNSMRLYAFEMTFYPRTQAKCNRYCDCLATSPTGWLDYYYYFF